MTDTDDLTQRRRMVETCRRMTASGINQGTAGNLSLRNPSLSARELNFAVQQTIDRIIFLRICIGKVKLVRQ